MAQQQGQPMKKIGLKEAIKQWEEKTGQKAGEVTIVKLNGWLPPIEKMDGSTSLLVKCEQLALSTNMIERLSNLNSLKNLKILSVGRNYLKSLVGVEVCADTLEEIWASYNQIEKPSKGVLACKKLRVLYVANNWIREWGEVSQLNALPKLEELVLIGNPLEERFIGAGNQMADWQKEVGKRITGLKKIDGNNLLRTDDE
jgi:dynein light chain 1